MKRLVRPEILDRLAPDDPAALRSRTDLRRIHFLMGNYRWVETVIPPSVCTLTEIGAGEGSLVRRLSQKFPSAVVTGVDLIPGPPGLNWRSGDLLEILPKLHSEVLVGLMILHHFSDPELRQLGTYMGNFRQLCFCEPWRSPLSQAWGMILSPWQSSVTRHDLPVSVAAGFCRGEIAELLGLSERRWRVQESIDWRGAVRWRAVQR